MVAREFDDSAECDFGPLRAGAANTATAGDERLSRLNWKKALPWAFYDWANSAYATTVLSGLFPVFFSDFWTPPGTEPQKVVSWLGNANSTAGIVVACLAPILGAIADR